MSKKKNTHSTGTPATTLLDRESVPYTVHSYVHDPSVENYGMEAAEAIGVPASRVFKTLLVSTGEPGPAALVVGIVPVDRSLDLKAMAVALGLKKVEMADPAVAERRTGYVVGGISPLAQRNRSRTLLDASALAHETVYVSGGHRGLDLELAPADLQRLTEADVAAISH
ncbi:Cys-tRNA(Pro) deacylase [Paeniglutamicibacter sulfureus]|jgi:Cys-tRNA(Pro)/Cys-tRNA(Cys) deacylase|uniref:Cys-tRNA(Pro)/Cys-tRNA(Cys) deacylase n=1 Tax=Paeniglutamicibacter sulfureus TaxID=43666 RepID=A0ABU2BE71_9MICC|nr:Cys-tRNA(Pro) deacylase [Paeniglutamicibacter sulfureus]MDR7356898.1 Cys-tRNA(Pro)/Cys-tRNA(Cys) deacylase [Paeniglutamicibacter sulfureus]